MSEPTACRARGTTRAAPSAAALSTSGSRLNDEADGVRFVQPADLDQYDIHVSMRHQFGDYLAGTYPYLG